MKHKSYLSSPILSWIVLGYGLLVLVGGIIGHLKSSSAASLITGGASGVLLLVAATLIGTRRRFGFYLAVVVTLILDSFFTYRYLLTLKFMPPGLLSILSFVVLICLYLNVKQGKIS